MSKKKDKEIVKSCSGCFHFKDGQGFDSSKVPMGTCSNPESMHYRHFRYNDDSCKQFKKSN